MLNDKNSFNYIGYNNENNKQERNLSDVFRELQESRYSNQESTYTKSQLKQINKISEERQKDYFSSSSTALRKIL
jgi:hypothetical protein